jgi:lipopolysaccharide transport system ATP-binding protein
MENNIAIKVENLSKAYQLGQIGTGTITRDLERFWATKILGKEDPFLKIGETNDRTVKGNSDIVWSLKDINFEIEQGDAVGIIGRNGAGKSTLLKLLSRVTAPTTGNIKVKGRIASLLEVGTGFHPELTGRENIYLNGAILGMRKKEIRRKFDEIVSFSGVERYIDTPVKRYSSGMYVRLAFAVAAHLESEILIVDEVLAVGDAEFQKKCLGKMGDVSKGEGRTILFVSHNLDSVKALCSKAIILNQGNIVGQGLTTDMINNYLAIGKEIELPHIYVRKKEMTDLIAISRIKLVLIKNNRLQIDIELGSLSEFNNKVRIGYSMHHVGTDLTIGTYFTDEIIEIKDNFGRITIILNFELLIPDKYSFSFSVGHGNENIGIRDYDVVLSKVGIDLKNSNEYNRIVKWDYQNWGLLRYKPEEIIL